MSPTLLFSSFHNYLDQGSGAAISAREVLRELARRGWRVRVLCGSLFDDATADENSFYTTLKRRNITPVVERKRAVLAGQSVDFRLVRFLDDGIEATVFFVDDAESRFLPRGALSRSSGELLLKLLLDECQTSKPNVYLTYGGYWAALPAARIAKNFGAANVFYLCNFAYNRRDLFAEFDRIVVPSEFAKSFYRQKLDVATDVIPPLIDDSKFRVAENSRRFLTFVNPSPEKGRYFFVGIARELERRFPEIPILVVESRSKITTFATSPEARTLANLYALQQVDDPREFYRQTRVLLAPSLWNESFGRVAVEAGLNGIPVVCSNRGALPEVIEGWGIALDVPRCYTPSTRAVPTSDEVAPWVDAIATLWNDDAYAQTLARVAVERVERYSFQNVAAQTAAFFSDVASRY